MTKLPALLASVALLATSALAPSVMAHDSADHDDYKDFTLIHAGTVLVDADKRPLTKQTVIIHDGKIIGVEPGYIDDDEAEIIDLSDHFVLPGLIDSHVHLRGEWNPNGRIETFTKEQGDIAYDAADNARKTLMAGFTAVQDVGGPPEIKALSRAIRAGKMPGPHIRASGNVSVTGGHGELNGFRADVLEMFQSPTNCDGPADCRRATRLAIKNGADLIKIASTGGVLSNTNAGTGQQMMDDELEAIVQTATSMGRKVTAHAHGKDGIDAALRAGVSSIEHGTYLDRETTQLFKENDAVLVPTVLAGMTVVGWATDYDWLPPASAKKALEVGPQMLDMLALAHKNGVTVAFGTDTGVSPHGENAQEFRYMKQAGMSSKEMLASATKIAAEHIEMGDKIGTLDAGKHADIIAVDGNPMRDITVLEDVAFVMKGGKVYKGGK